VVASAPRRAIAVLVSVSLAAGAVAVMLLGGRESGSPPGGLGTSGATYYVSVSGSDEANGRSPDRAWATVARAGRAELRPGDEVRFRGGETFEDAELEPAVSGTREAPIVYGSYGTGRARLTRSVFLRGTSWVTIQDLDLAGADQGIVSLASSPSGARGVTIQRNRIRDTGIAVNSAHEQDADWLIRDNEIARTRDSAVIVGGERARISDNSIVDAGMDESIEYGKHGIYLKGAHGTVVANRIRGFPDGSGVSVRRHDSRVERNEIADGPVGISWFQEDSTAGTSRWTANRISGTTRAAIYVSPSDAAGPTRESFVITGNRLSPAGGVPLNLAPTAGRYTVAGNPRRR
jgi:copper-binding protein NosD